MANWKVIVHRCDNRLAMYVNDNLYWERYYDYDPQLNEEVPINVPSSLPVFVRFVGYNGPMLGSGSNPWHFHYKIYKDGTQADEVHSQSNAAGGGLAEKLVFAQTHRIQNDTISRE